MNDKSITHLQEAEHHLSLARIAMRDAVSLFGKTDLANLTAQESEVVNITSAIESYATDLFLLLERN